MSAERFKSREKGVDTNIVSNMRLFIAVAVSAILSSGCGQEEKGADKDLSGIQDEPDAHMPKEAPVKKQAEPIKPDKPDAGQMSEEEYKKLYDRVVEVLRLKNGRS